MVKDPDWYADLTGSVRGTVNVIRQLRPDCVGLKVLFCSQGTASPFNPERAYHHKDTKLY